MDHIVYSDLDGTLLDGSYSFEEARSALNMLRERCIPLVLCSSKTRSEIEEYRGRMGLNDPFISENGSAIYVPDGTFSFDFDYDEIIGGHRVIGFGRRSGEVRRRIEEIREVEGLDFKTFNDLTAEELSVESGLQVGEAVLAKQREYSEVILGLDDRERDILEENGLNVVGGGRYFCVCESDKGTAVKTLTGLYRRAHPNVKTIGLGDSRNDVGMLEAVDIPVLVQKPDGSYENMGLDGIVRADGVGPVGWASALDEIL
ncbi:MAG: HAD-IIB family hydrolase [Candidatus Altiarchaeales archaeon]|nr:HAD-IIB family hydrolase [Candidatus Altiarchaeales archaeon]MBD3416633.1 HAD-IIB family hydrolase [Candidatus Altiarchaeales archaeon]